MSTMKGLFTMGTYSFNGKYGIINKVGLVIDCWGMHTYKGHYTVDSKWGCILTLGHYYRFGDIYMDSNS